MALKLTITDDAGNTASISDVEHDILELLASALDWHPQCFEPIESTAVEVSSAHEPFDPESMQSVTVEDL